MFAQAVRVERFAHGFAIAAVAIGLAALLSWMGGWPHLLASFGSDYIPMAPNTAVAFQLLGVALLLVRTRQRILRFLMFGATLLVLVIAGSRSMEFLLGMDWDVDYWLIQIPLQSMGRIPVGEMAFPTCLGFLFAGSATLLLAAESPRRSIHACLLALATLVHVVGVVFALGYIYGQPLLYGGQTIPMAFNTGIAFAFLGVGLFAATVSRDVRARHEADLELRRTRQFLDSVIEHIPNMVFAKDAAELRFVLFNRAGESLLGVQREVVLGKNDFDFFPADQAEFFVARDQETLSGATLLDIPEEPISTRHQGTRILHTQKIPILGPDGAPRFLLGISEDITERKVAEERIRALNSDLSSHAKQLEAANQELEAFAYSVSHDLRAPLRHMVGFGALLRKSLGESCSEASQAHLDTILKSSERMGKLIDDLLAFSRMGRAELSTCIVDLGGLVEQARADLTVDLDRRRITWRIGHLPRVLGDRSLLQQVISNLLANAVKFTRDTVDAVIEVDSRREGADIVVFVRDNGAGFDMKFADKLFGVFQRLHSESEFKGTGIGLAHVRRIIAKHGGRTWAEGFPGGGATFYFSLPQTHEEACDEPHLSHTVG